ncbi:MAG: hypothetical protein QM751_14940 [Paludibacteraceae bacterium]
MEGINLPECVRILNQKGYKVLFTVALGYRDVDDFNQSSFKPKSRLPLNEVIVSL